VFNPSQGTRWAQVKDLSSGCRQLSIPFKVAAAALSIAQPRKRMNPPFSGPMAYATAVIVDLGHFEEDSCAAAGKFPQQLTFDPHRLRARIKATPAQPRPLANGRPLDVFIQRCRISSSSTALKRV
jgi:hypothetical protein